MSRTRQLSCLCALAMFAGTIAFAADKADRAKVRANLSDALVQLPLAFEANQGQADPATRFVARGSGYTVLLRDKSAVLQLSEHDQAGDPPRFHQLSIDLEASSPNFTATAEEALAAKVNYLIGSDRKGWRTGIPTYARVRYAGIYPGIDLVYYGKQHELEYDFEVAPGADPSRILLCFRGAGNLEIAKGDLIVHSGTGEVRMRAPLIYQETASGRKIVDGGYELQPNNSVGFTLGTYDRTRPLVIDPVLAYSTYFGGAAFDTANAIAVDNATPPNAYVTGEYCSASMPVTPIFMSPLASFGGCHAFVLKLAVLLDGNGNVNGSSAAFVTYFGDTFDVATGIAVDPNSTNPTIYVAGYTTSPNFPVTSNAFQTTLSGPENSFYLHLDPTGSFPLYSTYLGGGGIDQATGIAVDASGNAYISGNTSSLAASSNATTKSTPAFPLLNALVSDTHGGVYVSNNAGSSWTVSRSGTATQNILASSIRSLVVAPATASIPSVIYAGTQGSGIWTSSDGAQTWSHSTSGLGSGQSYVNTLLVDPQTPTTVYAGLSQVFKTTNSGATWTAISQSGNGPGGNTVYALAMDNAGTLYALTTNQLYALAAGSTTWTAHTMPGAGFGSLVANPAIPNTSPATLYAGATVSPNSLYVSTNGGSTWSVIASGTVTDVMSLAFSADGSTLYAGTQTQGVYTCVTSTQTCAQATATNTYNSIVAPYVRSIAVVGSTAYAATSFDIFQSTNSGTTWTDIAPTAAAMDANDLNAVAIDTANANNVYVGTSTQDAYIASFNSDGALRYSTLWGGGRMDNTFGIAADANGNAYIVGQTYSNDRDFPFSAGPGTGPNQFAYLTEFSFGTALSATYSLPILGNSTSDVPRAVGVGFDPGQSSPNPNVYLTGQTCSNTFPVVNPYQSAIPAPCSAFVIKAQPSATSLGAIYSTYFGPAATSTTIGNGIAADANGNAWFAGQVNTSGTNFPIVNAPFPVPPGTQDRTTSWLAEFNPTGSLLVSTFFGGSGGYFGAGGDIAKAVAVDAYGNVYIAGTTNSPDLPTLNAIQPTYSGGTTATPSNASDNDAFIARFDSSTAQTDVSVSLSNSTTAACYNPTGNSTNSGCQLSYTAVALTNSNAASNATQVAMTVTVTGGAGFSIGIGDGRCALTYGGQQMVCNLGTLAIAGSTSVPFTVTPLSAGSLTVTAYVSAKETDTAPSNNTANNSVSVLTTYSAALGLAHTPDPVVRGTSLTQTLTITNLYDTITSATVTFTAPSAITSYGTCAAGTSNTQAVCTTNTLASNQAQTFTLTYLAPAATGTYTASAQVTSSTPALNISPATANDTLNVVTGADLALTDAVSYSGTTSFLVPGQQATLQATVTNNGPDPASSIVISTTLSPGLQIVSMDTACSASSATSVTCNYANLSANSSITRSIVVQPTGIHPGFFTEKDRVSSVVADPIATNNFAIAQVQMRPSSTAIERMIAAGNRGLHMLTLSGADLAGQFPPVGTAIAPNVFVSPNGRIVYGPRTVADVPTGAEIGQTLINAGITSMAMTSDGMRLIYALADDSVRIVDATTLQTVGTASLNGLVGDDPSYSDIDAGYMALSGNVAYLSPTGINATTHAPLPLIKLDFSSCVVGATGPCAPVVSTLGSATALAGNRSSFNITPDQRYLVFERSAASNLNCAEQACLLDIVDTSVNPATVQESTMPLRPPQIRTAVTTDANDPFGTWLYMAGGASLWRVDLRTGSRTFGTVTGSVNVGYSMNSIALSQDGSRLLAGVNTSNGYALGALDLSSIFSGTASWALNPVLLNDFSSYIGVTDSYIDTVAPNPPQITTSNNDKSILNDQPVTITIQGSNFSNDARVFIPGMGFLTPNSVSPTQLEFTVPAGAPISAGPLVITNVNASAPAGQQLVSVSSNNFKISGALSYQPSTMLVAVNGGDQDTVEFGRGIYNNFSYYAGNLEYFLSPDGGRLYSVDGHGLGAFDFATQQVSHPYVTTNTSTVAELDDWAATGTDVRSGNPTAFVLDENDLANPITLSVVAVNINPAAANIGQEMYRVSATMQAYYSYGNYVVVTPNGRFAYAFAVDYTDNTSTGTPYASLYIYDMLNGTASAGISLQSLGFASSNPYSVTTPYITPDGGYLIVSEDTDVNGLFGGTTVLHVFSIDQTTGALTAVTTLSPTPPSPQPFPPQTYNVAVNGQYLYTLDPTTETVYAFNFQPGTNLSQIAAYQLNSPDAVEGLGGNNALAITPDGSTLYIPLHTRVYAIDTGLLRSGSSNPITQMFSPGLNPVQLLVSPATPPSYDLALTMTGPSTVKPGAQMAYSIQMANSSANDLPGVVLRDPLPPGTSFVSAGGCQTVGTQQGCGTCDYDATHNVIECPIGTMTAGATITGTLVLQAPGAVSTVTNVATAVAADADPNTANNTATVNTSIAADDLVVSAAATAAGYTATVTNLGPSDATNVVVTDTLMRFGFVSATASRGGPCTFANGVVTCPVGTILHGGTDSVTVTIVATAPDSGWASNEFNANGDQYDTNPVNNKAQIGPVLNAANTPTGVNVTVQAGDPNTGAVAEVTYTTVTSAGSTSILATTSGPPPPAGYRAGNPLLYYNLSTTAQTSGAMLVSLNFFGVSFHHPDRVRIFHLENGAWVDRTAAVNAAQNMATASTASLSTFAVFEPVNHAPVANAGTSITQPGVSNSGAQVALDGSASSDADSDTLTYRWTGPFPEGNGVVTGARPSVTLPLGASQVTLVVNDGEVDSAPANINVTVSDFAVDAGGASAAVPAGAAAKFTLSVTPKFGAFNAPVTFACSNAPPGMSCSFTPTTVTPGASGGTTQLSVATTQTSARAVLSREVLTWMALLFAPFGVVVIVSRGGRKLWWTLLALIAVALIITIGCGGGTVNGLQTQTTTRPSTTTTLTVSATSGGITHATTVTITTQ
jgi:uncharacterized repeat protein (TIGR01451 family)